MMMIVMTIETMMIAAMMTMKMMMTEQHLYH